MSSERSIRDPIHGFVSVQGRELDVLDTPLFQRLRRIHQLAMARLVYPGALHTRFDHTLGVLHVAGRLCAQLDVDEHHTKIIRLAALLHDIGHGPFSHVSESILSQISGAELERQAGKKDKIHKLITHQIILDNSDLGPGLSARDREEIVKPPQEILDCLHAAPQEALVGAEYHPSDLIWWINPRDPSSFEKRGGVDPVEAK